VLPWWRFGPWRCFWSALILRWWNSLSEPVIRFDFKISRFQDLCVPVIRFTASLWPCIIVRLVPIGASVTTLICVGGIRSHGPRSIPVVVLPMWVRLCPWPCWRSRRWSRVIPSVVLPRVRDGPLRSGVATLRSGVSLLALAIGAEALLRSIWVRGLEG